MGLALSIIAGENIQEKVWYHTCNSKGNNCTNRQLKDKKGCTIWYDEELLLEKIEKRLHNKILVMNDTFELPEELQNLKIKYGEDLIKKNDNDVSTVVFKSHFSELKTTVKELNMLETRAQNIFLTNLNFLK
jgi:ATP-dependent RNA helicase DDX1